MKAKNISTFVPHYIYLKSISMKRLAFLMMACLCIVNVHAAYLRNIPKIINQPDGTVLHCFASGDEFFNYLHDKNGYTIIQHPQTGYYVYAEKRDGKLVATNYIAGVYEPESKGIEPYALLSPEEWMARRQAWKVPDEHPQHRDYIPNHGTLNNISIFIRFSDDEEFTNTYSSIDNMFNNITENAVSMRSYFKAASYGAIEIPTTFYPGHNGETIISYQDINPRSYFQPYNASTNTNGYNDDDERREREFSLLERAVNYINTYYPVPTNLNIDYNDDGYIDNVCFIVRGEVGEWSSLLWPHQWSLWDRTVDINGKRLWTFNFQLADAAGYFNTSTMCHEMNHSLGAPDLYHYSYAGPSPAGIWDLMENNTMPPQHCGAYMKMKYGHWIDEIPEITQAGTYTLNPISSSTPTNIAYKIRTDDPNQFYVLEYRDNTSLFETGLPGSGLLVYRIDTRFDGNASYDPSNGIYDEVYIFRPEGSFSQNGNLNNAYFSSDVGRTEFSSSTSAYPFFNDGTPDYNFRIYNITKAESTISFMYGTSSDCAPPTHLVASLVDNNVSLSWNAASNASSYNIYRNGSLIGSTSGTTYFDNDLFYGTFTYFLKSVDSNGLLSTASESVTVTILPEGSIVIGNGGGVTNDYLPSYSYYNYSLTQQIYTAEELGEAGAITSIAFYNGGAEKTRTYDFYLKSTMKSTFSSNTDWEIVSDADKVFSGNVTMTAETWTIITFDTPFVYDGISNVILVVDDNSGAWTGSPHMSCSVFNAPSQAIRVFSDGTNFKPVAPPTFYSDDEYAAVLSVKNQLLLIKEASFNITALANPEEGGTVTIGGVTDETLIVEPFEEYTIGDKIASSAIIAGHDWWTTWSNALDSSEDGEVANLNGTQCAHFSYGNDQVLLLGDKNKGEYDLEFDILVPEGKNGYFNILHHFAGSNSNWAMQCYLHLTNDGQNSTSAPGHGTIHAGSNSTADILCVYDAWMHFRLNVNIDTDTARCYYTIPGESEIRICEWQWSLDSFGENVIGSTIDAINFYPPMNAATSEFYVDNITFTKINANRDRSSCAFAYGSSCVLTATPNLGYIFDNWTKDGVVVSTEDTFDFTVTESATYVANFSLNAFHFVNAGNWGTASNWQGGALPGVDGTVFIDAPCQLDQNATVATLTVTEGQSLTLKSGTMLTVTNTLTNTATTGLVFEDDAQLVHNSENVSAMVKKNIAGHGADNGKYCLISNPLVSFVNPENTSFYHLTSGTYDLYDWLTSAADNLEWRNFKDNTFKISPEGYGYLYANQNDVVLNFPGTLRPSHYRFAKAVSYNSGDIEHPGWNLIGNPFVCNVYLVNENNEPLPYYRMNAEGNDFELVTSGAAIAPMEGVFYQASENGTVYFIRTAPTKESKHHD